VIELTNIKRLEIKKGRWSATIRAELESGETLEYLASADSGLTWGDGLFLGTREEYEEAVAGL
jgi:hypothetical protein